MSDLWKTYNPAYRRACPAERAERERRSRDRARGHWPFGCH